MDIVHFNQSPKRDARFIKPPNILKAKVGSGGLEDRVLDRAQKVLENNDADFIPAAENYLANMMNGVKKAQEEYQDPEADIETLIAGILFPAVQLKANGGMFNFPLVTRIADRFVQFMEVVDTLDADILEIAEAFHKTIRIVLNGTIKGTEAGSYGDTLAAELNKACMRYFEKNKRQL